MTWFPYSRCNSLTLTPECCWNKIMKTKELDIHMRNGDQAKWSSTRLRLATLVFAAVVTAVASLGAQTSTTGDVAGVVTDPTAAVLSGVSVTLKNVDTGGSTSTTTNAQGSFNFPLLQPGHYSVSAIAQ